MNIYVKIGWPVLLREAAQKVFGHRTKKALDYVASCADFHKTYEFLHAFTEASIKVI